MWCNGRPVRWTRCVERSGTRLVGPAQKAEATELKGSRWLLLRNVPDLTANETAKLLLFNPEA
jgi:hypothetical protein